MAWVPEGLPATVNILLTIAAKRMATQNVLVKGLQGVETFGAITLLATDKTGTLTRNQMTAANIWTCDKLYSASAASGTEGNAADLGSPGVMDMLYIFALCSRARFDRVDVPIKDRKVLGDATESALTRYAAKRLDNFDALASKYEKVFEQRFNSDTKWQMSIHKKAHAHGSLTLYIKGVPERIWLLCNRVLTGFNGASEDLTEKHRKTYDETYGYMASRGHRVLGFAQLLLPGDQYPDSFAFDKKAKNFPTCDFTFMGLSSLENPPKHGVREAIGHCRAAGIKVIMVTGDHPLTAEAIDRKTNLILSETKGIVAKRMRRPLEDIEQHEYNAIVVHGEQN